MVMVSEINDDEMISDKTVMDEVCVYIEDVRWEKVRF